MCRAAAGVFARLLRPVCFLYYITFCPGLQGLTPGFLSVHEDFSFLLGLLSQGTCAPARPLGRRASLPCRAFLPCRICYTLLCSPFSAVPANLPPHLQLPAALPFPAAPATAPTPSFCSAFRVGTLCCAFPAPLLYCDCSRSYKIVWTGMVSRETTSHNLSGGRLPNRGPGRASTWQMFHVKRSPALLEPMRLQTGAPAWMIARLADVSRETIPSTSLGAMRLSNRRGGPDNPVLAGCFT